MRLVDICEFFSDEGGGVKTYVHHKLEECAKSGVKCTIIAPAAEDRREQRLGGDVIWVKSPTLPFDHRYFLFNDSNPVHSLLDELKPTVVEGSSTWKGAWIARSWRGNALKTLFLHQDPVAVYPHSLLGPKISEDALDALFFWFWQYMRRLAKGFGGIVVGGQHFADRLVRFGLPEPAVIPLGVEKHSFSPLLRSEKRRVEMLTACGVTNRDAPLFVVVSRHHPEKRIKMLIDAFSTIRRDREAALYVVGDGPSWRSVHARASNAEGVSIAGPVSDRSEVAEIMSSADYLLHGGAAETFGIVIAEALCSGLPIIIPDRGGAVDFSGASHAEVYRAGDAKACAAAINRMLARDRKTMAKAAFDASAYVKAPKEHFVALLEHYERLARNAPVA
ncbi:MAG: glycosyltransferase [Pseudomonadota bacterium]